MRNLFDSIVRTVVPWAVGGVVAWFASLGIEVDAEVAAELTLALTTGAGTLYYIISRVLETYVSPRFGWLLGIAKAPDYHND